MANYTVTGALGSFPVMSAVYNPAADTVTLHFSQRLNVHLSYTITVNGLAPNGVTGANGLLLDGADNGQPGSNYVNTFDAGILAGTAAEVADAPPDADARGGQPRSYHRQGDRGARGSRGPQGREPSPSSQALRNSSQ